MIDLPGLLQRLFLTILVILVNSVSTMRFGSIEIQTELPVEIVVSDRLISMRLGTDGSCVDMPVILYQHRTPAVREINTAIDLQQDLRVCGGQGLYVQAIASVQNLRVEDQFCLAVLDLNDRFAGECILAICKPVETLGQSDS